jgi:hypothetical protein
LSVNYISLCFLLTDLCCIGIMWQLFPELEKVVFLDDDVVVQKDLSPLWDMDLHGKVNGAVETCHGDDAWVMSKTFKNYFNFSHPIIAKTFDPDKCAWAYGMNVFDLHAWRQADITGVYHYWQKQVFFCTTLSSVSPQILSLTLSNMVLCCHY